MTSFKDFRDKVICRVKSQSQTEISTKDFDEDDIMEQDQDANLEHIVTIKDEEILEPSYVEKIQKEPLKSIEPTKKKEISKISMNIRRLMAGLPKKANNSHLGNMSNALKKALI